MIQAALNFGQLAHLSDCCLFGSSLGPVLRASKRAKLFCELGPVQSERHDPADNHHQSRFRRGQVMLRLLFINDGQDAMSSILHGERHQIQGTLGAVRRIMFGVDGRTGHDNLTRCRRLFGEFSQCHVLPGAPRSGARWSIQGTAHPEQMSLPRKVHGCPGGGHDNFEIGDRGIDNLPTRRRARKVRHPDRHTGHYLRASVRSIIFRIERMVLFRLCHRYLSASVSIIPVQGF